MEPPATLSRQALDEFKTIYREEFGEAISDGEAEEMAIRLLRLFDLLSRPNYFSATDTPPRRVL